MPAHSDSCSLIDLHYLGRSGAIAAGVIPTPAGMLLVDPGPTTCVARLEQALADSGIGSQDLHGLLLTHIHLDHAGATGTLVERHPHLLVYVHERGAPHLLDPTKLLASARRLYGDDMDRLWGAFAPVPAANVRVPADGGVLDFGGAAIDAIYTRGHASHHVCYRDRRSGLAFVGDTGGIRVGASGYVLPPTPPPDIDVALWQASLARIRAWRPTGVFITHFGLYKDAEAHLDALGRELEHWEALTRTLMTAEPDAARRAARFVESVRARMRERMAPADAERYRVAMSLEDCWAGLARYWEKTMAGAPSRTA
jgi:glyoxylase-like metal-dependent hydrolase (beta-lactamase superfamily II)